ncbi:MAG: hypothetical protein J2P28_12505 [Actinobacteria bacterium]|nr:hypothetical protein [Actinomycetota bacterium]
MPTDLSTPQAPHPIPDEEMWDGTPNVVLDGEQHAIGWQRFPPDKGGPAYVTVRRGILGGRRVLERYPLTDDGWARAWAEFARLDPDVAEKTRIALGAVSAARSTLFGLVLSAIEPSAEGFAVGQAYDLRHGEDGLQIGRSGSREATAEYAYADIAAVQVTGFERVMIGSKFVSAYLYIFGSPMTLDARTEYRTHLRVQTVDRILDFWRAGDLSPEVFRRWVEPVNSAIRAAWLSTAAEKAGRTDWLVSELSRLAERLEHGTLTGSDFDVLKARVSGGL